VYNPEMDRFFKKYKRNTFGYEVGKIDDAMMAAIGAKTEVVTLSDESLAKNMKHHPDIGVDDYMKLDEIVGKGDFIAKDSNLSIVAAYFHESLYFYAIKSTQTGKAVFLTSFRKANDIYINRLRRKSKAGKIVILKDELP